MLKKYLIAPGPTPVPEEVLLEIANPILHHRTSEFSEIFAKARAGLQPIFGTKEEVIILSCSGTGAMEAAITNTLSKGDKILVVDAGKFGSRWTEIAQEYDVSVEILKYEWGKSANSADVKKILDTDPSIKAVCIQGSETSTAVCHPLEEIGKVIKDRANTLFIVDGITSVGVQDTQMDKWGIDILITGSQKAFMMPPGLAFMALSKKAWRKAESSNLPAYYFDLITELENQKKDTTAWTPSVNLIFGLLKVIKMIEKEGLQNLYHRHAINAKATREGLLAMGLDLLATDLPSLATTAFMVPEGVDGGKFVNYMREKVGITFAGGQDHLKGKIVRVSHLGYHDLFDTIIALSSIEMGLKQFGYNVQLGKGVAAAQEVFMGYIPKR